MHKLSLSILFIISMVFWHCSENSTTDPTSADNDSGVGSIRIILVDSPATWDSVVICVSRVEVHKAGSDTTQGSWFTINDSLRYFDLLKLTNGATAVLGDTSLAAGKYTQIRLIVEDGSYVIDDGVKEKLKIPSESQSGIKLNHSFDIESENLYEFYLDFNVDKSIIQTGNGQYKLKPVIRIVPYIISGSISGQVLALNAEPTIWTMAGSDTVLTCTDVNGLFKLMALPEGIYDVNIIPADTVTYKDTTITGINVLANQNIDIGTVVLLTN
ncbi:MAG: DUF4382 domain-containing protein [Candidatus Kariarchaeaceae archaeon]|jgi:hypothetical protein